jgi:glycosyltransferase involved in cell wall biosynthesis
MNTDQPLISIITAVRNGADYLRPLIESVLQQDYPNVEHIIIDDGSSDGGATVEILQCYSHLRWWSRENKGQYATQNEGIAAARGEIIGIISADDLYETPDTFSQIVQYWRDHPDCKMVYGKTLRIDATGQLFPYQLDVTGKYPRDWLRYILFIQHCSLFIAREMIARNDIWFDPTFKYAGDWDWIIRLSKAAKTMGYIPRPFARLRIHANQTTQVALANAIFREHQRVCYKYGVNFGIYLLVRKIIQYRAMGLIAADILRRSGIRGLIAVGRDWRYRRSVLGKKTRGSRV